MLVLVLVLVLLVLVLVLVLDSFYHIRFSFFFFFLDLWGRKQIMSLGLLSGWLCSWVYGFSSSFYLALFVRFIAGLTNANLVLTR